MDYKVRSGTTRIAIAETAAFKEFASWNHLSRLLCIKNEGHQSGDHKQEHVSEFQSLEVFKGIHCRVVGVVVNAASIWY